MTTIASDPGGVTIRPAERADLLSIFRIEKASFPQPWPFAAFERYLDEPGFLVATEGGNESETKTGIGDDIDTVVGYVVADTVPNHRRSIGHIKDIAVHPDHREQGVGSRLLERALGILAAEDVRHVKLEVRSENDQARSLYERFGFEHHHVIPRYYANGDDAFVLVVDLDDRRA